MHRSALSAAVSRGMSAACLTVAVLSTPPQSCAAAFAALVTVVKKQPLRVPVSADSQRGWRKYWLGRAWESRQCGHGGQCMQSCFWSVQSLPCATPHLLIPTPPRPHAHCPHAHPHSAPGTRSSPLPRPTPSRRSTSRPSSRAASSWRRSSRQARSRRNCFAWSSGMLCLGRCLCCLQRLCFQPNAHPAPTPTTLCTAGAALLGGGVPQQAERVPGHGTPAGPAALHAVVAALHGGERGRRRARGGGHADAAGPPTS